MNKHVSRLLILLLWIGIWWIASEIVHLPLLLPGPMDTVKALIRLGQTGEFWRSTGFTLVRVAAGYSCAVAAGVLLAVLCHVVKALDAFLTPLRSVIRATPVSSFIILVLLWISRQVVPGFISFLMVLPIVWTGLQEALDSLDQNLLEMTRQYGFSTWKRLKYFYYPSVRPALLAACVTGLGFAWKSGIAAEVIALPQFSIGGKLYDAKVYLESADLFAWTVTVILLSMALEAALKWALNKGGGAKK